MRGMFLLPISLMFTLNMTANAANAADPPAKTGMRPGVRYITGSYRIAGWEDKLVTANPNLGRWNWSTMVGYTQSTAKTSTQAIKLPLPSRRSHYVKPVHLAMPMVHTQEVAARVETKPTQESKAPPPVMTYGNTYSGSNRLISHNTVSGVLMHHGVSGGIISRAN